MFIRHVHLALLAAVLAAVLFAAPAHGGRGLQQLGVKISGHVAWGWSLPAGIRSFNQAFGRGRAFAIPIGIGMTNTTVASQAITVRTNGTGLAAAGTAGLGVTLATPGGNGPTIGIDVSGAAALGRGPFAALASADGSTGSIKSTAKAVGPIGIAFNINGIPIGK